MKAGPACLIKTHGVLSRGASEMLAASGGSGGPFPACCRQKRTRVDDELGPFPGKHDAVGEAWKADVAESGWGRHGCPRRTLSPSREERAHPLVALRRQPQCGTWSVKREAPGLTDTLCPRLSASLRR